MRKSFLAATALAVAAAAPVGAVTTLIAAPAFAQEAAAMPSGDFVRKQKRIKGGWSVEQRGDQTVIVFADNFRAAGGPDLKVFLSPHAVGDLTGKTAIDDAVLVAELTKTKGGQEYIVPAGVNIDDFESVIVHCEAYSVLWGGGNFS